ncbi:MAG TPA: hypothetical protein VGR14_06530 [Verrucomicrobiae bacterium]|nr:hypothetical protein [Verrucomicrobiae bacterium]
MSKERLEESQEASETPLDPAVTPELFREWRSPRFGRSNPERMNNPVWEWLIRSKLNAYLATERLSGTSAANAGPGWCFDRFGQSSTRLPDGRHVLIAGEHEDFYDSDFYIYNDVVVLYPDGKIDIFGYPRDIFPPTDFHSATLAGNRIIIIGSLGYPEERKPGITPVAILDLEELAVSKVATVGVSPGWLHRHIAILSEDGASILIRLGTLDRCEGDGSLVENIDDWRLRLTDWSWERLTEHRWQRWEIRRVDRNLNHLWQIRLALFCRDARLVQEFQSQNEEVTQELGAAPDLALVPKLYRPGVLHDEIPKVEEARAYPPRWPAGLLQEDTPKVEDEHNVFRIRIDGIVVRYVEGSHSVQMTVEGELPQESSQALAADLVTKLSALENAPYEARQL